MTIRKITPASPNEPGLCIRPPQRKSEGRRYPLYAAPTPAKEQKHDYEEEDEADASSAIVANPGAHVIAAAAEKQQ